MSELAKFKVNSPCVLQNLEAADEEDGYSLTTINQSDGQCVTTKLTMPTRRHPYDAGWCSKQGLTCAFLLILSVMVILGLAYWLNLHEAWFERKTPEEQIRADQIQEDHEDMKRHHSNSTQ